MPGAYGGMTASTGAERFGRRLAYSAPPGFVSSNKAAESGGGAVEGWENIERKDGT